MKKLWSILCVCALMLAVFHPMATMMPVSAATDVTYTIGTVKTDGIAAGKTFTVDVTISKTAKICMVEFLFAYDATKVKAISSTVEGPLADWPFKNANVAPVTPKLGDPNIGEVWITGMNLQDCSTSAGERIATITFKALTNINKDLVMYGFQKPLAAKAPTEALSCAYVNGGVDVLGDGSTTTTTKKTTTTTKKTTTTTKKTTTTTKKTTTTTKKATTTTKKATTTTKKVTTTTKKATTTTKKVTTTTKKTTTTTKKPTTTTTVSFSDVTKSAWYYDAVQYVAQKGYMTGFASGKFGPAANMQRQDFVVTLSRIAGADLSKYQGKTGGLQDVPKNAYYAPAVAWAVDKGIVTGYQNGKFGVGDPITREQVCTIFYRYEGSPKVSNADNTLKVYPDSTKISAFAKDAVAWASQKGVMSGMADGKFSPTTNASRAQVATIVMRMDQANMF